MNEVVDRNRSMASAGQAPRVSGSAARDMRNRVRRTTLGSRSEPRNITQCLQSLWQGHMSPTTRALVGLAGGGVFLWGLTQKAPLACVLGTVGLGLVAAAAANASVEDIANLPGRAANMASKATSEVAENLGFGQLVEHSGHSA